MNTYTYDSEVSTIRRIVVIASLVIQTIVVGFLVYLIYKLIEDKNGIYYLLLICGRIACTIDSYLIVFGKKIFSWKPIHYVLQIIGSITGIILFASICYMFILIIWVNRSINLGLVIGVLLEELTYFTCNVLSYEMIGDDEGLRYSLVPQTNHPIYYPASFKYTPYYPALEMKYLQTPFQMNIMPNMSPPNMTPLFQYNESVPKFN